MNFYVSVKIVYTKNAFIISKENEVMIKETKKSKSQAGCCCPQILRFKETKTIHSEFS